MCYIHNNSTLFPRVTLAHDIRVRVVDLSASAGILTVLDKSLQIEEYYSTSLLYLLRVCLLSVTGGPNNRSCIFLPAPSLIAISYTAKR